VRRFSWLLVSLLPLTPSVGSGAQSCPGPAAVPAAPLQYIQRDDPLIMRALPLIAEWRGDSGTRGLLPDSRDTTGLDAVVGRLKSSLGARTPLVLLSIVHWGYSGYGRIWQDGLPANLFVDAGFPLEPLEAMLLDTTEIQSARIQAFDALGRGGASRSRPTLARLRFLCDLATSFHASTAGDSPAENLLASALYDLAIESLSNDSLQHLLDDSAITRSAGVLQRRGLLPPNWRLAPTPPLLLSLDSSRPGRETTVIIVAQAGTVSLQLGFVRSSGDTIFAITPLLLTIAPSARHVLITTTLIHSQLSGSFNYSWRGGVVAGDRIEIHHDTDTESFAMTAARVEITH
jgi:hypothetical protein